MTTISKAIELLNLFTADCPELGLAEFQRLTRRDKATTYRYLCALESTGLLEQDAVSRAYRLGPAILRLAHVREVTVPRRQGVRMALPRLADRTGETAHASILEGNTLVTLADHSANRHAMQVVMHNSTIPLHATGSGLAVLAFADAALRESLLDELPKFTHNTMTRRSALMKELQRVRQSGFGIVNEGFEEGVSGIGVPLFDSSNHVAGAVAVASVSVRMNDELIKTIKHELVYASQSISHSWGGEIPAPLRAVWDAFLTSPEQVHLKQTKKHKEKTC